MAIALANIFSALGPVRMEAQSPGAAPPAPPKRAPSAHDPTPGPKGSGGGGAPGIEGPRPGPARGYVFTVEVYALAQDDAAQVLEESGSGEGRHQAVLTLMKEGKAQLETLLSDVGVFGQRSVVESCDEARYPTEYTSATGTNGPLFASAFETRDVGDIIETEITEFAGLNACNVNMVLQRVHLLGFPNSYANTESPGIARPLFRHDKLTVGMTLALGDAEFLGTLSNPPQSEEGTQKAPNEEVRLAFGKMNAMDLGGQAIDSARPEGGSSVPPNVEMELTFYSLDREAARQILSEGFQGEHCYDAVKALADKHEAKLERLTVLKTNPGQRALVEEVNEMQYATEFGMFSSGTDTMSDEAVVQPKSFQTRNLGLTLEVEPSVDPSGKRVDINMVPDLVSDAGDLRTPGVEAEPQPVFETRKITTEIATLAGEQTFIGTFNHPGDDGVNGRKDTGRVWFGFVRATL
jgi:hypothetical protein